MQRGRRRIPVPEALQGLSRFAPPWFQNRAEELPDVYTFMGTHPQRLRPKPPGVPVHHGATEGVTYVIFVDTSRQGKDEQRKRPVPGIPPGRESAMQSRFGAFTVQLLACSDSVSARPGEINRWRLGHGPCF